MMIFASSMAMLYEGVASECFLNNVIIINKNYSRMEEADYQNELQKNSLFQVI